MLEARQLGRASVLRAKREPDAARLNDAAFRRDALCGLDRCAGESISEMLRLVEVWRCVAPPCPPLTRAAGRAGRDDRSTGWSARAGALPHLRRLYAQLSSADPAFARRCAWCLWFVLLCFLSG